MKPGPVWIRPTDPLLDVPSVAEVLHLDTHVVQTFRAEVEGSRPSVLTMVEYGPGGIGEPDDVDNAWIVVTEDEAGRLARWAILSTSTDGAGQFLPGGLVIFGRLDRCHERCCPTERDRLKTSHVRGARVKVGLSVLVYTITRCGCPVRFER